MLNMLSFKAVLPRPVSLFRLLPVLRRTKESGGVRSSVVAWWRVARA